MGYYTKKKSKKQEDRTALEFGGRPVVASGALWNAKGDARTPELLIENKFTDKDKYKLELKTWKKIENEATRDGLRIPMMQIDIQDLSLVVVDYNDLSTLFNGKLFPIKYYVTPHKSITLHKDEMSYLEDFLSVYVVSFGRTQLAFIGKEQYFLIDK